MNPKLFFVSAVLFGVVHSASAQQVNKKLPAAKPINKTAVSQDWLISPVQQKAAVYNDDKDVVLTNGLVKRIFRIQQNVACIDYSNLSNNQQLLRAVKPEAVLTIDGKEYNVGGLYGQKENAYLIPEWVDGFKNDEKDFQYQSYSVSDIIPFLRWQSREWALNTIPASGKMISFVYKSNMEDLKDLLVTVHYELYNGIPLMVKWLSIENKGNKTVLLNRVVNEILGTVEEQSAVVGSPAQMEKQHGIYVETNYAFNNSMRYDLSDQTTHWKADKKYTSQVNYDYETPCLLEVYPEKAAGIELEKGQMYNSVRTNELLIDSYDRERRGLAIQKMYGVIAPWTMQNPIFMHLVSRNDEEVKAAIDQCVATGYEALILSFGSHCNMEDSSAANVQRWKALAGYAHSKHIMIGGYSLFSSRRISDEDDVIDPVTKKPDVAAMFGHAPCMGSKWGLAYLDKIKYFISNTGFDIFENDGPYPGDLCASTNHPGHKNLDDSQWKQMELQKGLYHWCNEHGVYVNAPDWYFLDGTNKIALGYREVNFSLPREQQMILNRQNIFDGTWEKSPSMGWGFVPLTRYQGGGPEAVLEPLSEHLKDYQQLMMQYYGAGVQACYRGPRLYDTETTRQMVVSVVNWYKKYRDILNSSIIHLRRADGRDWDGLLHVNSQLSTKGMLMLYNPLKVSMTRTIKVPLYYTGLTTSATVREKDGLAKKYSIDRQYEIELTFTIAPESYTWYTVE
ncbi:alpha-galactosidase [Chitinophagaceae bacterium 26-R-25]|nr:alpha-galactosidase [Chitinophagaceae bacterium 26-R-25]